MSNVSIYEKNWIDLVFEGKNKTYGAYQLRQENAKTSLVAFLGGIAFILSIIGGGFFLTSFDDAPIICKFPIIDNERILPVDMEPIKEKEKTKTESSASQEPTTLETKDLSRMVVTETQHAIEDVPTNQEIKETPPTNDGNGDGNGTLTNVGNDGGGENENGNNPDNNTVVNTNHLDKLPEYPGGIEHFYKYVSKNINRPEIDEATGEIMMRVVVAFVIEKDGSMTDIRALRSTDKDLEKEAIRVLKSLKTKWTPGEKNGQLVRTLYMLPIKVKL